ncbi:MAG: hypothetical protein LBV46_01190 [Bacteroidales bacterium]|jgi:predicted small secreted protein|nr:hypothetical protein [Bacteroidales bacterium]
MKKLFVVLAAVAMIAVVSSSCNKTCKCTIAGVTEDMGDNVTKDQCKALNVLGADCSMQ